MQCHYLTRVNRWIILPASIVKSWIDEHQDYHYCTLDQAPKRTVYLLTYHYPRPGIKEAINEFIQDLISTLKENLSIKVIE